MVEFHNTLFEKADGIATITINRPQALNALNEATLNEISSRLSDANQDQAIKVIVITGTGDRAFCAGADLNVMKTATAYKGMHLSLIGQKVTSEVEDSKKPVIAAINGYALGGGLELAMACDLRIAATKAKLGQPEVNVGLIPGWGGTQRLPRFVGKGIAKEMIFTGENIDAERAEHLGLVNRVVPPEELQSAVKEMATKLMSKPPIGLELAKHLVNRSTEVDLASGLRSEAEAFGVLASTKDFKEGVNAFLEKRKPQYKGN
ncbi:MAG: enoyl-CoA hydratase/isomerase family protein [Candidatus Bathyarchaeota archaeon]|nr:MAG: enoyl-CoA hydratase/isomerase family protein [Candidatus Bathyarchaeota archaeon]